MWQRFLIEAYGWIQFPLAGKKNFFLQKSIRKIFPEEAVTYLATFAFRSRLSFLFLMCHFFFFFFFLKSTYSDPAY